VWQNEIKRGAAPVVLSACVAYPGNLEWVVPGAGKKHRGALIAKKPIRLARVGWVVGVERQFELETNLPVLARKTVTCDAFAWPLFFWQICVTGKIHAAATSTEKPTWLAHGFLPLNVISLLNNSSGARSWPAPSPVKKSSYIYKLRQK